jgi:Bardet-Biedl syndrome 4 protein
MSRFIQPTDRNAYLHYCFTKKDFPECLRVIESQLKATDGQSEYSLYIKALILRNQGRLEESLRTFQAAFCLNIKSVDTLKQIGRSLYLLGKHRTALEMFEDCEKLLTQGKEDREIFHNKGLCYVYLKQYEKAIEAFREANMIQRHESTYIQLARVYRIMSTRPESAGNAAGNDEEALAVLTEALDDSRENPELLTSIGLLHLKAGNSPKAFEFLGNSLTYDPRNPKTILAAASIVQDNQDMDVALMKYRVAVSQTPNSAQLWNNIGMCFFGKGKLIAAIACLKRAAYLSPFEWIISFNLGIVHLSAEQYASAYHYFSTAINFLPTYARSYMYLAITLAKLDDFEDACLVYEKATQISDDYMCHLNYALTLHNHDEKERAREQYVRFQASVARLQDPAELDDDTRLIADQLKNALLS